MLTKSAPSYLAYAAAPAVAQEPMVALPVDDNDARSDEEEILPAQQVLYHEEEENVMGPGEMPVCTLNLQLTSVAQVWNDWKYGLGGGPAVEYMEAAYGTLWRKQHNETRYFNRRRVFIVYITRVAEERNVQPAVIVDELDSRRVQESLTLDKLRLLLIS